MAHDRQDPRHVTRVAEGSQKPDVMFYKKKALDPGLNAQFGGFSTPFAVHSLPPFSLLPNALPGTKGDPQEKSEAPCLASVSLFVK